MKDTKLDSMLDSWTVPEVPASMRDALRSRFQPAPRACFLGVRPRWILAFAATAGALAVGASLVRDGTIGSDAGPWDGGVHVRRSRIVHPFLAKFAWAAKPGHSSGWQRDGNKLVGSVYIFDEATRTHYGYTWNAEPLGGGQYRFRTLPLDRSVLRQDGRVAAGPLFERIVGPGSTFEVDLYVSENQRVYDRYELSGQPLPLPPLEGLDGPNVITLTAPQLFINGVFALDSGGVQEASSEQVDVSLRGRGRYVLTLIPRGDTRFQLAGTASGNTIEFQSGGDSFRIVCTAPVTTAGSRDIYLGINKDEDITSSSFGAGGLGPRR